MATCDNCGKEIDFTHVCKSCDGRFCTKCKSKSAHDCPSVDTDHDEERSITFSKNKIKLGGRERGLTLRDNDRSLDHHHEEEHEHKRDYRDYHEEPAHTEEHHEESRGYKWKRQRPHWEYSGPGGANLKVIARLVVLAFIVILVSGAGPFHNDAIATAGHTMWDGIMNLTNSLPDNSSVNITVNTP